MKSETAPYHKKTTQTYNKTRHSFTLCTRAGTHHVLTHRCTAPGNVGVLISKIQGQGGTETVGFRSWEPGTLNACPTITERVSQRCVTTWRVKLAIRTIRQPWNTGSPLMHHGGEQEVLRPTSSHSSTPPGAHMQSSYSTRTTPSPRLWCHPRCNSEHHLSFWPQFMKQTLMTVKKGYTEQQADSVGDHAHLL